MVEHQPRLLGSRVRLRLGRLRFFPFLPKLHFQFPFPCLLSLSPFPPLPFPSSSFPFPSPFDLSFALKKSMLYVARAGNYPCGKKAIFRLGDSARFAGTVCCFSNHPRFKPTGQQDRPLAIFLMFTRNRP